MVEAASAYDSGNLKEVTAACPAGKVALDGSAAVIPYSAPVSLVADGFTYPTGGLPNTHAAIAKEAAPSDGSWQLIVKVMCASIGS